MNTRVTLAAFAATIALAAATLAAVPASAQPKMGEGKMMGKKPAMGGKMMGQSVYVCKMCKTYYSAADARKMKMMDPMGHKLVMMKKAPVGYKMMKMGHGNKMGHDKMMNNGKMKSGSGKM